MQRSKWLYNVFMYQRNSKLILPSVVVFIVTTMYYCYMISPNRKTNDGIKKNSKSKVDNREANSSMIY